MLKAVGQQIATMGTRFVAIATGIGILLLTTTSMSIGPTFAMHRSTAMTTMNPVVALPGYHVSLFARGTAAYHNPDSLLYDGTHIFVGYQNTTAKDGSDNRMSTIVEYSLQGQVVRTFSVLGHNDGLRLNPYTHLLWALTDEDGNPHLTTIDPVTGASTLYRTLSAPHGGGYDDIAFTNGMAFIDASNPTLDKNGVNSAPALDKVTLSNGQVTLTPVLMGNGSALDMVSHKKISLNLIDPDSLTFDRQGHLVLDNQGGSQLVFISGVGTPQQKVSALSIGNQVDDTAWATASQGQLLIADTSRNAIYLIGGTFVPGTIYAAFPNDSGVAGAVGTIDETTGIITPVAIGFGSPHGMLFIANSTLP